MARPSLKKKELQYHFRACTSLLIPAVQVFLVKHVRNVAKWVEHHLCQYHVQLGEGVSENKEGKDNNSLLSCIILDSDKWPRNICSLLREVYILFYFCQQCRL